MKVFAIFQKWRKSKSHDFFPNKNTPDQFSEKCLEFPIPGNGTRDYFRFLSTGDPLPQVTWWRDKQLIDSSYETTYSSTVQNTLTIPKVTRSDLGSLLTCQSSNNNISIPATKKVTVDLKCEYDPPLPGESLAFTLAFAALERSFRPSVCFGSLNSLETTIEFVPLTETYRFEFRLSLFPFPGAEKRLLGPGSLSGILKIQLPLLKSQGDGRENDEFPFSRRVTKEIKGGDAARMREMLGIFSIFPPNGIREILAQNSRYQSNISIGAGNRSGCFYPSSLSRIEAAIFFVILTENAKCLKIKELTPRINQADI